MCEGMDPPAVTDVDEYHRYYDGPIERIGSEAKWMKKIETWRCRRCRRKMGVQTFVPYDPDVVRRFRL